jgi:hypothetical protein
LGGADVTAKWSVLKLIAERVKETGARGIDSRELESLSAVVEDLVRDGVLVREQQELWFSHEALFDQVIARSWAESERPLVSALLATDQDLSHRSLVRQVLTYQRGTDRAAYERSHHDLDRNQSHVLGGHSLTCLTCLTPQDAHDQPL